MTSGETRQPGKAAWLRRVSSEPDKPPRMCDLAEAVAASTAGLVDFDELAERLGSDESELFDALTSLEARRLVAVTADGRIRRAYNYRRRAKRPATFSQTGRGNLVDTNRHARRTNTCASSAHGS